MAVRQNKKRGVVLLRKNGGDKNTNNNNDDGYGNEKVLLRRIPGYMVVWLVGIAIGSQLTNMITALNNPSIFPNDIQPTTVNNKMENEDVTNNSSSNSNLLRGGPSSSSSSSWPAIRKQKLEATGSSGSSSIKKTAKLVYLNGEDDGNNVESLFYSNRALYREKVKEFAILYTQRIEKDNTCGIRFNHAFALWLSIVELKPKMIIESGVNSGVSTWFMRQAASTYDSQEDTTLIVSIDPEDKPICGQPIRWLDDINQERYLGKSKFVDFTQIDWHAKLEQHKIKSEVVFVYFDDHLPFFPRVSTILKYGFQHVMLEDNYKLNEGATPGDKWATPKQLFAGGKRPESPLDAQWLIDNLRVYAEFPPLVAGHLAPDTRPKKRQGGFLHPTDDPTQYEEPVLHPDVDQEDGKLYEEIVGILGVDKELNDKFSYTQIMNYCYIAYMEFKTFAPTLRQSLSH